MNQKRIAFDVSCIPPKTTAQQTKIYRMKNGQSFVGKSKEAKQAQETYLSLFAPFAPDDPIEGPVHVSIRLSWPFRKSDLKPRKELVELRHTSRPDLDNLCKSIMDALVILRFIPDDNAVCNLTMSKTWSANPGVRVSIEPYL